MREEGFVFIDVVESEESESGGKGARERRVCFFVGEVVGLKEVEAGTFFGERERC